MNLSGSLNTLAIEEAMEYIAENRSMEIISSSEVEKRGFPKSGMFLLTEVSNELLGKPTYEISALQLNKAVTQRLMKLGQFETMSTIDTFNVPSSLYMDIAVVKVDKNKIVDFMAIEVDGEGHVGPVRFGACNPELEFEQTVISDCLKDILLKPCRINTYDGDKSLSLRIVSAILKKEMEWH